MKYRAEIDGLRALAVIPVIFFHAGFESFSGGFVGVDVFFVISGYLITTIIIQDIENKRFSLINFYERRARRILPALFFVMVSCIPFAWMWMMPSQLKDFSESFIAVGLFISNIFFWSEDGYFASASEEKPLLHTWSLAVEEQYYLLFPLFLLISWRFGKDRVFWIIVIFAAVSLGLSEWGWRNRPSANFYLFPTRAWELFAGSIAAFLALKRGVQTSNLLSFIGLAGIALSILIYDKNTPFPSVYALVPVISVMLLLLYGDKETLAAKFLSTKTLVAIGLISYSAYLWHQPIFAFARIYHNGYPSQLLMGILCPLAFILAFGSWKYIEKPFRNRSKVTLKKIFLGSTALLVSTVLIGSYGHFKDGFKFRIMSDQKDMFAEAIINEWDFSGYPLHPNLTRIESDVYVVGEVNDDNEATVLIGDSHAHQYWLTFGEQFVNFPEKYANKSMYLQTVNFGALDVDLPVNTKTVVLSYFWSLHLNNPSVNTFIRCCGDGPGGVDGEEYRPLRKAELNNRYQDLIKLIQNIKEKNVEIFLVLDNPFGEELHAKSLIEIHRGMGLEIELKDLAYVDITRSEAKDRSEPARSKLIEIAENYDLRIIDPIKYLCPKGVCEKYSQDGYLIYKDYDHLSIEAVRNKAFYMHQVLD